MKHMILHWAAVALIGACTTALPARERSAPCLTAVPATPPDSVPRWVYDERNAVNGTWVTGTYTRDVLVVLFLPGTSQKARAEAICAVQGEVIGGRRFSETDGYYHVRIPADPTQERMRRAMELLNRLPQVIDAGPEFVDNAVRPA